jgi:transglutaminase-like putative cysteine protease
MINMKKKSLFLMIILVFLVLQTAGCNEFLSGDDGTVNYVSHPTRISYTISYGYDISFTGEGSYEISYDCDIPELLSGTRTYDIIYQIDYTIRTLVNNEMVSWDISSTEENNYKLGIIADVTATSYLVSDLNGLNSLNISQIALDHSYKVDQYYQEQSMDDTVYVDPDDPSIVSIMQDALKSVKSENAFLVAKQLFIWLKGNTEYSTHKTDPSVQPAARTCQIKSGDCDDLTILYLSLCRSAGIPARFIRGIIVEEDNGVITAIPHAWAEVFVGGNIGKNGWIPVECAGGSDDIESEINQNFALENCGHLRLFQGTGSNESFSVSMSGPEIKYYDNVVVSSETFVTVETYNVLVSNELSIKDGIRAYK